MASTALTKVDPAAFQITPISEEVAQVIHEELDGLGPIPFDTVKVPSGGGIAFEVPSDDPETRTAKRTWWVLSYTTTAPTHTGQTPLTARTNSPTAPAWTARTALTETAANFASAKAAPSTSSAAPRTAKARPAKICIASTFCARARFCPCCCPCRRPA